LLLAVVVAGAGVDDATAARPVLAQRTAREYPRLEVVWADGKYHNHALNAWKADRPDLAWRLEVVSRPPGATGFVLPPKRWAVERTFARLGRARRLSKDYERRTDSSGCMIRLRGIQEILARFGPPKPEPPFKYRVAA
jgi:putative transposase